MQSTISYKRKKSHLGLIIIGLFILIIIAVGSWFIKDSFFKEDDSKISENQDNSGNLNTKDTDEKEVEEDESSELEIVMFHNGSGPMCLDALEFFAEINQPIKEYLNTESDFRSVLLEYEKEAGPKSEGVSDSYSYYPIIFINQRSFSGFNEEVKEEILREIR